MDTIEFLAPFAPRTNNHRHVRSPARQSLRLCESAFCSTLLAIAGHDLRQPLQVIASAHDVLATMLDNTDQRDELAQATDATAQLAQMLNQLVEVLQFTGGFGEDLASVPLQPILERLATEFERPARLKQVALCFAGTRGLILSHPALLASILRNLVRNAIDYTPPGGAVFVTSRQCGPELHIEVRDTGIGIRAHALPTIFGAFQQAGSSRPDGLGLGLFIVKSAADLLGHRIEVQSVEGHGSCFTVRAVRAERSARRSPEERSQSS